MAKHDPNGINHADSESPNGTRHVGRNTGINQPVRRPYSDAGNLYEIPRIRPDDPPLRRWWIDDEPQQDENDS